MSLKDEVYKRISDIRKDIINSDEALDEKVYLLKRTGASQRSIRYTYLRDYYYGKR